jgi:hypothetical protein
MERLGSKDQEAIASYRAQHEKRLRKLQKLYNLDATQLSGEYHVPVVKIRYTGERNQQDKTVTITADLSDDKYNLTAYNVYVNDVPLYRGFGLPISGSFRTITEKIELTEGDNKIEVSCLNDKGAESYRALTFANYKDTNQDARHLKPRLFYIGFGVSQYTLPKKIKASDFTRNILRSALLTKKERSEMQALYAQKDKIYIMKENLSQKQQKRLRELLNKADATLDLKYADRDAKDLAETFRLMEGKEYSKVIATTFTNKQVTADSIKKAKDILKDAAVDDTVILFISGHGVHDTDKETTYYYLTYNADLDNLSATAAPFDLVEDLMLDIKPRKKLFFMDTCESGEVDDAKINSIVSAAKNSKGIRARSIRKRAIIKKAGGAAPKRAYLLERERYIYNDLFRRSGAIVFSSCQGNEVSYEDDALGNGFFTTAIKRALKEGKADANNDKVISTDELRNYVAKEVPEICRRLRFDQEAYQHPTVDRDNLYMKLRFPAVK